MAIKKYTAAQLRKAREIVDQEEATRAERVRRLKSGATATAKATVKVTTNQVGSAGRRVRQFQLPIVLVIVALVSLVGYRQLRIVQCLERYRVAYEVYRVNNPWSTEPLIINDVTFYEGDRAATWDQWTPFATERCAQWAGWLQPSGEMMHPARLYEESPVE